MFRKSLIGIFLFFITCNSANSSKILAIFPSDVRSHYTLGKVVFEELARRGHRLTVISQFQLIGHNENITEVHLEGVREHLQDLGLEEDNYLARGERSVIDGLTNLMYGTTALVNYTLGYPKVQEIINNKLETFDLLLIDMYFTDSLLGLAYYWNIPAIVLCSAGTNKWTNEMVGNPHNPAYNPSIFLGYTDKMSLKQRLVNALGSAFEKITYNYMYLPSQEMVYKRYFENLIVNSLPKQRQLLPPLSELIHNVSLVLLNSHSSFQYPRPYVPNMVQIGGMHIERNGTKLSQHIDDYISAAPDGVIYMSLGTQMRSVDLSAEHINTFLNVFTGLIGRMRVIWKWENATLPKHPSNVIIGAWLPQQAILEHPNVKIFITNGGLLSVMEAIHSATPVIGIPLYGDQDFNVAQIEHNGFGKSMDLQTLNETILQQTIKELIDDQTYQQNVNRISRLFKDNPIDPLELAIYNIEYVLRTNGARHLRSAAVDLSLWTQNLFDVSFIIAIGIVLIIAVPSIIICIVLRKSNPINKLQGGTTTSTLSKNGADIVDSLTAIAAKRNNNNVKNKKHQ